MAEVFHCPKCGSNDCCRIFYGKPSSATMKRVERGEGILGGCMITGNDPNRYCPACRHRWIDETDPAHIASRQLIESVRLFRERKQQGIIKS
jgi:hypothetical protein